MADLGRPPGPARTCFFSYHGHFYHSQEANQALLAAAWRGALPHKKPQKRLTEKKALKEGKPQKASKRKAKKVL
jgi:hypothetical protein